MRSGIWIGTGGQPRSMSLCDLGGGFNEGCLSLKREVAQRVDDLAFLYTDTRLRHQRNKTTLSRIVPSYLRNKLQRRSTWCLYKIAQVSEYECVLGRPRFCHHVYGKLNVWQRNAPKLTY